MQLGMCASTIFDRKKRFKERSIALFNKMVAQICGVVDGRIRVWLTYC